MTMSSWIRPRYPTLHGVTSDEINQRWRQRENQKERETIVTTLMHSHTLMNGRRFWERSNVNNAREWVLVENERLMFVFTARMLNDLLKYRILRILETVRGWHPPHQQQQQRNHPHHQQQQQ
jgi:hypothetical protein